jgi:protein-L-isoaspartate(D-aspartate) O-methyltransferase
MTRRVLLSFLCCVAFAATADPYAAERGRMVRDQIQARGIRDARVIKAMLETPRHLFMPQSSASLAYMDQPAPIGHGATISQPYIVARMTELLEVKPEHQRTSSARNRNGLGVPGGHTGATGERRVLDRA